MPKNEESSDTSADFHRWRKTPILHGEQIVCDEHPLHELEFLQPILDPILRQHIVVQRRQIGLADRFLPDPPPPPSKAVRLSRPVRMRPQYSPQLKPSPASKADNITFI